MVGQKTTIGRTASAAFPAEGIHDVPVKIDTGADSSSIWVSALHMTDDNALSFILFGAESPYYSGKIHKVKNYKASLVRSSNGSAQVRYKVQLSIVLEGRKIRSTFTLADRSKNTYPVLVGCSLLNKKFIVDVSKRSKISPPKQRDLSSMLTKELRKNPRAFFKKYHIGNQRGDIEL
jgi:hypothetical protein